MTEEAQGSETLDKLPLDSWHRSKGARMVPFAGYEMPVQYEGIIAEHLWTRENAGLFDVSHMGQLLVHGRAVDAALETIQDALSRGSEVNFTGFGKFSVNERGPRQGVNPRTGERITIPGGKVPKFSAGAGLKSAVKGG